MKKLKKLTAILVSALCISCLAPAVLPTTIVTENVTSVEAASISAKKKTIAVGTKYRLKVNGTKKTVKWSSSNKKVATVSQKGLVKGIAKGKATISAKVGNKTYKCRITVKANEFKQKATKIEKLKSGYLHFYPLKVYYANGKLYYKCRIYNRRASFVKNVTDITLDVEAKVDGYKHIIAHKKFTSVYELGLNADTYTNSDTDLTFVFSGKNIYDKTFDLTSVDKIYYTASYRVNVDTEE